MASTRRIKSLLKWFYPGMRVKRWLLLTPLGLFFVVVGVVLMTNMQVVDYLNTGASVVFTRTGFDLTQPNVYIPVSGAAIGVGLILIFISFRQVIGSIASVISPIAPIDSTTTDGGGFSGSYSSAGGRSVSWSKTR